MESRNDNSKPDLEFKNNNYIIGIKLKNNHNCRPLTEQIQYQRRKRENRDIEPI